MELKGLKTEFLGRNQMFFASIYSTQTKLKSLKKPENGTIIIADNQVSAIGTHNRRWYTGMGNNIAMSFVLFPHCEIMKIADITIRIAECIIKAMKKLYKIELTIKEPNDICYHGKKIAGILTETSCKGEMVEKIYVGIGINVNQESFPGNLSQIATSLKIEFKQEFERERIITEFLNIFEKEYQKMIK